MGFKLRPSIGSRRAAARRCARRSVVGQHPTATPSGLAQLGTAPMSREKSATREKKDR
ncbi:MAG: hypothetical protein WBF52_19990 [Geitlerinemataceae cyanobacterium]